MLEPHFEAGRYALEIVWQQILAEVPGCGDLGPRHAGPLVGAHEHPAAFLTDVNFALEIDGVQLFFFSDQFRHVAGDEVLMLHGQNGQFDAHHAAHLARPQPRGIHDMLRMHIAVIGDHVP